MSIKETIHRVFSRKPREEDIASELIKKVDERFKEKPSSSDIEIQKLKVQLEKLTAYTETFKEVGKLRDERLSRLTEKIGELRTTIAERDKRINELEQKAIKAADMVEAVQPQALMAEVKKQEAKANVTKAKLESYYDLLSKIKEETKNLRRKVSIFRGLEEVIALTRDIRKDISAMNKISSNTKKHADKVESFFVKSEKALDDLKDFKRISEDLNETFGLVLRKSQKEPISFKDIALKDDITRLDNKITALNEYITKLIESPNADIKKELELLKERQKHLEDSHKEAVKRMTEWTNYVTRR